MIQYKNLKAILLKAVGLHKDRTGLVLVERIETNQNGTTYRHMHWVKPDQVKSTDKVLRGHHNLQSGHPQKLTPVSAGKLSQESKDKTELFFKKFSNTNDFFNALTKMGITWKTNAKLGINLMWAKMGLRAAIHNGFDADKVWDKIKSTVSAQPTATQPTATQPTATQPTATQPTATQPTANQPTANQPQATQPQANQPSSGIIAQSVKDTTKR